MDMRKNYDFWKLNNLADAEALALRAKEEHPELGVVLAYDKGPGCTPRYGIIEAPQLGDDVSYGFNGDCYPCGKVEKIGKNYKRIKAGGRWYFRRGLAPVWQFGCWNLLRGIHDCRNQEF